MFLRALVRNVRDQQSGRIECSLNHTAKRHRVQLTATVSQVQCGRAAKPTVKVFLLSRLSKVLEFISL